MPSATLISVRMPATGDGISASTLSVEISKSGSSVAPGRPASSAIGDGAFEDRLAHLGHDYVSRHWFPSSCQSSKCPRQSDPAWTRDGRDAATFQSTRELLSSCPLSRLNSFGMLKGVSSGIVCGAQASCGRLGLAGRSPGRGRNPATTPGGPKSSPKWRPTVFLSCSGPGTAWIRGINFASRWRSRRDRRFRRAR